MSRNHCACARMREWCLAGAGAMNTARRKRQNDGIDAGGAPSGDGTRPSPQAGPTTPPPSIPRYLLLRSRRTVVVQPESIAAPPQSLGRRRGLR